MTVTDFWLTATWWKCFLTSRCLLCPPMRCMHSVANCRSASRLFINFMIEKLGGLDL